ncbi:sterol esterase, partial [Mycena metata]
SNPEFPLGASAPTVVLSYGTFQGFTQGNVTKYLGVVPFAIASRFEALKAPEPLQGIQNATAFGPACPQQSLTPLPGLPISATIYPSVSEQSLNCRSHLFTPSETQNLSTLPVFVWMYGGGFQDGNSRDNDASPIVGRSIETGEPIIAVAINYRLSAFGFLPGKEVGAAGISNLGLRDQIFALKWVRKYISVFGGDPQRVVIGGLSAGSISAATLLLSNKQNSNALFRGAFLESGAQMRTLTLQDGQPVYDGLVAANNCTSANDTLDCLRRVPFDSFMATVNNTQNFFSYPSIDLIWRPYIDGDVVGRAPLTSVSQGLFAKIPIMTGNSDDEGTYVYSKWFRPTFHFTYFPVPTLFSFSTLNITCVFLRSIGLLYPEDPTQGSPFNTRTANQLSPQYKRLAAFQGDHMFIGHRRLLLEHASRRQNTWSWLNKLGKNASVLGASHGGDVGVWFTTNTTSVGTLGVDALVNFINTLDPNLPAKNATEDAKLPVLWPQWNTPSGNGSSSLLTFTDDNGTIITAENFRIQPIGFLNNLLLKEASSE